MKSDTELVVLEDIGLNNSILDFFRGSSLEVSNEIRKRFVPERIEELFYDKSLKDTVTGYTITYKSGVDRKSFRLIMRDDNGKGSFDKEYILDCLFVNGVNSFPDINTYINNKPVDYEDFKTHFREQTIPKKSRFGK